MLFFDRPGYGESDPNLKRFVKSEALDIEELADKLELGSKFYVMGISMGAYPAWSCLNYISHRYVFINHHNLCIFVLRSFTTRATSVNVRSYRCTICRDISAIRIDMKLSYNGSTILVQSIKHVLIYCVLRGEYCLLSLAIQLTKFIYVVTCQKMD